MLGYVYGHDAAVCDFVSQMIPSCRMLGFPDTSKAIGVIESGRLIAGIVYHNWDPEAKVIEISGAALPHHYWLSRETIRRMYQYPFLQIGCQMVVQRNDAENERLLYMLARYGYSLIKIPRMLGRDKDGVLACLTYEDWRDNKFNKRFRHYVPDTEFAEAAE